MNLDRRLAAAAVLAAACAIPGAARADRRAFTYTYEHATQPEGGVELELYNTQARSTWDDGATSAWEGQIAIEYGITDRTDVSAYQVFAAVEDEGVHYAATRLRLRHRLAERGAWPADVLLYAEVAKPFGGAAVAFEPRLVIAKDFGALTAAVNLVPAFEVVRERAASGDKELGVDFVPGWAAGLTYELGPLFALGAETWATVREPFEDARTVAAWAGPVAAWSPTTKLWITATAGFGVSNAADDFLVRFVAGLSI